MAPVDGIPPTRAEAIEASPWPNSSRSGSQGVVSVSASATLADRRLSMAASTATATAGPNSWGSRPREGTANTPTEEGRAPMRVTCQPATPATTVATTTARSDAGSTRWRCGSATMTTATMPTRASAGAEGPPSQTSTDR